MKLILPTLMFFVTLLPAPIVAAAQTSIDRIIAIVDESVITERELENRVDVVRSEFERANRRLPGEDVLYRRVLEALITDSVLLQEAARRGIKTTDTQLNQAMQRLARQNDMSLSEFREALIREGYDYESYRETVRLEVTVSTLQRQYGQRNASISESEVDDFIAGNAEQGVDYEYRLSHILVAVPDAATPVQVSEAQQIADDIVSRLEQGEEFDQLANTYSAGETALQGGDLGWRRKAQIPSLFTDQVLTMDPGDFAGPIRSASGFHILQLSERRGLQQNLSEQTRSRHILIKPNELVTEEEARARLLEFRQRILDGEDFARLARLYSVDYSSGSQGGDIGWMEPGASVPEYEEVVNRLEVGEVSEPFSTRFGWHIVEVIDRRTVDETEKNRRNKIYSQLLEQKQREVFDLWRRRLRDGAYVVYVDEPDA
jgi:peptidyl-prolyl cis-trans isomerase SurA